MMELIGKRPIGIVNPVVKADNDSCGSHLADPDIIYNPDDNSIWLFYMNRIHKKHTGSTINLIRIKSDLTYSTAQLLFRFNENDSNTIVSPCIWRGIFPKMAHVGCEASITKPDSLFKQQRWNSLVGANNLSG